MWRGPLGMILFFFYEYKTCPVVEKEIPELSKPCSLQMTTYREATVMLFSMKTGICLFFTHEAKLVEL